MTSASLPTSNGGSEQSALTASGKLRASCNWCGLDNHLEVNCHRKRMAFPSALLLRGNRHSMSSINAAINLTSNRSTAALVSLNPQTMKATPGKSRCIPEQWVLRIPTASAVKTLQQRPTKALIICLFTLML